MAIDLQTFLRQLDMSGELKKIDVRVDSYLEIGAIADRVMKQPLGGPALLFSNINGNSLIPVAINLFGSYRRINMALGFKGDTAEIDGLSIIRARIERFLKDIMPDQDINLLEKAKKISILSEIVKWLPKTVNSGCCQDVIWRGPDAKLSRLPVLTTWPGDAGPFITLGLSHIKWNNAQQNMGLYRLQVHDDYTLGFHAQMHHDGAKIYYNSAVDRLPVAITLGDDPILTYAATAPLPAFISEILFAGFLRQKGIDMVRCVTNNINVPANSEIVIEGWIDTIGKLKREGPFGDHTGYYSLADDYPVIHVEAITHRINPIFPATIVGHPPNEDSYLGLITERLFVPILKLILPELVDIRLPSVGSFHNLVIISIRKEYPGHAQKVMNTIWGTGQMMFSKIIVVLDYDVDLNDPYEILFCVTSNVDPKRDLLLVDGPLDILDHSSDEFAFGGKVGIDATRKNFALDRFTRIWPKELAFSDEIIELVSTRWKEYGF